MPPQELAGSAQTIRFVTSTPGAIGYIDEADAGAHLNILFRK